MELYVGCPMWAHQPWQGLFLPDGLNRGDQLAAYATWCNAVEGNTTFYGLPSAATVAAWAARTPPGFRFAFKAPRSVTHDRRLRGGEAEMADFFDLLAPLGDRADPVTIQLPASFGPTHLGDLARFLSALPDGRRVAVEVRHPDFFIPSAAAGALERLLERHDAEWVVFDTETFFAAPPTDDAEREAWSAKPRVRCRTRALTDRPVVRYLGRSDVDATVAGWQRWKPVVAAWVSEGRRPQFFIHTPDNVASLALARQFHDEISQLVPGLTPLPDPLPVAPATLF